MEPVFKGNAKTKRLEGIMRKQEMKFMLIVIPKGYEKAPSDTMGDPKGAEAMMRYVESLQIAGVFVDYNGLQPTPR
jgi:hypothetical protein